MFPTDLIWLAQVEKIRLKVGAIDGGARPSRPAGPFTPVDIARVRTGLPFRPTSFDAFSQAFRIAARRRIDSIDGLVANGMEHCVTLAFDCRIWLKQQQFLASPGKFRNESRRDAVGFAAPMRWRATGWWLRDRNTKLCWSRRLVSKPTASIPELGQRIRIRRKTIGMTQAQLASSIGISFQQMQKYEKGINAISSTRLAQICDVLSLPHDFFETTASPLIGKAEPVDGYGSNPSEETIRRFLDSSEGQRLIASFMRIVDKRLRTRILDFVASIADD